MKIRKRSGDIYSLVGATWTSIGNLDEPRRLHACVVEGKYMYMLGGFGAGSKLRTTEILDLETRELQSGPILPWGASSPQAFIYNGTVYVVAGNGKWAKLEKSENIWTNIPNNNHHPKWRQVFPPQLVGKQIIKK